MLLRSYFKLGESETHEGVAARISARLAALGESSWPAAPALTALLGVPVENAQWDGLDPRQRRQYTLDVARRLILRESQVQPLLLILEDLHWIDAETQAWLNGLVDALLAARLLLLVTYRPEYQHAWGNRSNYTQLRVNPLPREGAEDLLRALLGAGSELTSLRELLIERTEGNPFFLEESVRALVETKALMGERGAYRLVQAIDTVQVPATVQAILASRIDRLPLVEKQLLQSAAVIGKGVPFNLLHAIANGDEADLSRQLGNLFPRVGQPFVTQQRRPILLFQEDHSPGKHDMLVAACNPSRYALLGVKGWHASCEENLLTCLRALGHTVEVPQPINLFTNIPLTPQGELDWQPALTAPGDYVVFRAEMDVILCASSCPQDIVAINDRNVTELELELL
jgi:Domain of unknown function (DUF1989)